MSALNTQTIPTAQAPVADAVTVEPIRLNGGWSGRVVTRIGEHEVLTNGRWEALLAAVVSAPEELPGFEMLKCSKAGSVFAVMIDASGGVLRHFFAGLTARVHGGCGTGLQPVDSRRIRAALPSGRYCSAATGSRDEPGSGGGRTASLRARLCRTGVRTRRL